MPTKFYLMKLIVHGTKLAGVSEDVSKKQCLDQQPSDQLHSYWQTLYHGQYTYNAYRVAVTVDYFIFTFHSILHCLYTHTTKSS